MRRFSTHQNETPEDVSSGVSFWAQSGILGGKGGGEMEYVPRQSMEKATEVILNLVKLFAE